MDNGNAAADLYRYQEGLEPIIRAERFRVRGSRVLLRAILRQDAYSVGQGVAYKTLDAEAHEVVAVGEDVKDIRPGQHVYCRSTAADRIKNDETSRYWLIDAADIGAVWDAVPVAELPPRI